MAEDQKIHIVACTDNKYVMPTGVMLYSLCKNNAKGEVRIHLIVDEGVTAENRQKLQDTVEPFGNTISFYEVKSEMFNNLPLVGRITSATYYRFQIADLLPQDIDRVLYLDVDLVVCQSLAPLWEIPMEGIAVGAVADGLDTSMINECVQRLGMRKTDYFNAGVLLINLKYWREHQVQKDLWNYLIQNKEHLVFADQDVLNAVFDDKKIILSLPYNLSSAYLLKDATHDYYSDEIVEEALKAPIILHFAETKPWFKYARIPYSNVFFHYRDQTCWRDDSLWKLPKNPITYHIKKAIGKVLRRLGLLAPLPPYEEYFVPGLHLDC